MAGKSADHVCSDIKQARQLLQNLILSNPKHAPGWIAAASLEGETLKFWTSYYELTTLIQSMRRRWCKRGRSLQKDARNAQTARMYGSMRQNLT